MSSKQRNGILVREDVCESSGCFRIGRGNLHVIFHSPNRKYVVKSKKDCNPHENDECQEVLKRIRHIQGSNDSDNERREIEIHGVRDALIRTRKAVHSLNKASRKRVREKTE